MRPLDVIGVADLPILLRVVHSLFESFELLVAIDVEVELEDHGALVDQEALKGVDVLETLRPHLLRNQVVDPDYQNILVVGAVENRDRASLRRRLVAGL